MQKRNVQRYDERTTHQRTNLSFRFALSSHELHLVPLLLWSRLIHVQQELHLFLGLLGFPDGLKKTKSWVLLFYSQCLIGYGQTFCYYKWWWTGVEGGCTWVLLWASSECPSPSSSARRCAASPSHAPSLVLARPPSPFLSPGPAVSPVPSSSPPPPPGPHPPLSSRRCCRSSSPLGSEPPCRRSDSATVDKTSERNVSLLMFQFCLEPLIEFYWMKHSKRLSMNHVIYLVDLHLCFPQLPLIALHITFQLQVVVLKAAD